MLQAEESNGNALINAVMASTARHPFWLRVLELMKERVGSAHNVLYATGAKAFRITNGQAVLVMLQCGGFQFKRLACVIMDSECIFLWQT